MIMVYIIAVGLDAFGRGSYLQLCVCVCVYSLSHLDGRLTPADTEPTA